MLKKTKTAKKAAEAVTKNADEGVTAVRKMTGNFNGKITELQNKVDSGVPISSAVSDYLDQREKVNNAVAKRRALNEASQSQGKGNRAKRRAEEIERRAKEIADKEMADIKINSEKIGNAIGQMRDNRLANDIAESYRGQGNKANRRIEQMRAKQTHEGKRLSIQKQIDAAADAEDLDKMISLQKQLDDLGEYKAPGPKKTFQERKAERIQKNAQEQAIAQEKKANLKIAREMESMNGPGIGAAKVQETSPSGGNASIIQQAQDKIKGNNFVYNMAAMGVGGGLVLNMANNKGQQTNAQLYGQY